MAHNAGVRGGGLVDVFLERLKSRRHDLNEEELNKGHQEALRYCSIVESPAALQAFGRNFSQRPSVGMMRKDPGSGRP